MNPKYAATRRRGRIAHTIRGNPTTLFFKKTFCAISDAFPCRSKLAERLAGHLGYRYLSRKEVVEKTAEKYGLPESKIIDTVRKSPSLFQKLSFEQEQYLTCFQAMMCEMVKDDNVVYQTYIGAFRFTNVSHVFRVRVMVRCDYRIKEIMRHFNYTEIEARKHMGRYDKERRRITRFLYGVEWSSPELYDIVFSLSGENDFEFVCDMVERAIKRPRYQSTPESIKAMRDLTLATMVKASLAMDPRIHTTHLRIGADDGFVTIYGKVFSSEAFGNIESIASSVQGVSRVENKVVIDKAGFRIE